jgi:hypothetical protein
MPQIPDYPENSTPADVDQLLGIINPSDAQNWAVNRFPISGILADVNTKLNEIVSALQASNIYPGEIVFTTNGQTFAPVLVLNGEATIEWTFADGSTSDAATPSVDFGSTGSRLQRLKVTPWDALYRINLGYSGQDGGPSTDEAGNTFEHVDSQPVTAIQNLALVKDTLVYLCGCGCPITSVDVADFTALYGIEFYGCDALTSANIHGTSNLRRACFERSPVGFLDFTESPLMEDVRGSYCDLIEIRWGATGQYLWHMCVRENSSTLDPSTWPPMNQFPVLRDMWISGNGITGDLVANSTAVNSAWLYNNNFSSIDMRNTGAESITAQNNPNCTTITIDGCPTLTTLDASGCALTQVNIDYLLATLDANGASNGEVNLSGGTNASPSSTGLASIANLEGKGWTCTYNAPTAPTLSSATIGDDGTTWTLVFSEVVQIGAGGNSGLAVTMTNAGAVTLTYSSGDGTDTLVYAGDVTVEAGDTVSSGLDYTQPGDGIENSTGYDLGSFTGASVTNNSSQGPPALISVTISSDGTTWTLLLSKAVQIGAGGNGGFALTMTNAGAVTLTYASGDGTDTLVYTGDVTVEAGDTVTSGLDYTQPGDGIEAVSDGVDLASLTGFGVTNNSEVGQENYIEFQTNGDTWGGHITLGNGSSNITWEFEDANNQTNVSDPGTVTFTGGAAVRTHRIVFSNPQALTQLDLNDTSAASVIALSFHGDFSYLELLHIYQCSITDLDITGLTSLNECHFNQNNWPDAVGDAILARLVEYGVTGGIIYMSGLYDDTNQDSIDNIATLDARGWATNL